MAITIPSAHSSRIIRIGSAYRSVKHSSYTDISIVSVRSISRHCIESASILNKVTKWPTLSKQPIKRNTHKR